MHDRSDPSSENIQTMHALILLFSWTFENLEL